MNTVADDDLLLALMAGSFESPLWSTFLDRFREHTGADYASLVFRPPGLAVNTVFHLYSGSRCPPAIQQLYRDRFYKDDPTPYHDMIEGRVYTLDELLCRDDPGHEAYLRAIMIPSGMNWGRMLRVQEAGGVSAWLTATRAQGEFDARVDEVLGRLVPYLRAVLHGHMALERERTCATLAENAIQRLSYGWITLDAAGHVLDANDHGRHILETSGVLSRDARGVLSARCATTRRLILDAVRALAEATGARPRAIVVSREPWFDLLLVPAGGGAVSAQSAPAVVAYVHGDHSLSADRCEQLTQLFGLLPSEARLALALGRGMSIAEAAAALNLTVESARTYSKKIYAKMGARGHADLVLFIHRSVLQIV